jgi:hypothetical protein
MSNIAWLKSLYFKLTGQWEVYKVIPNLFQGSKFQENDWGKIVAMKTALIIDLEGDVDTHPEGIELIHWPIKDGDQLPNLKRLWEIAEYAVDFFLKRKRVVLAHCSMGKNRSGLMNAVILMRLLDIPGREAMQMVRDAVPGALFNPVFVEYLKDKKNL